MFTSRLAAANLIHRLRPGACVAERVGNELTFMRPDGATERVDAGSARVACALLLLAGGGDSVSWAAVFESMPEACFVDMTTRTLRPRG